MLQNRGYNTDSKKTLKQKEDQMKNTMLLFITMLLYAAQPIHGMEKKQTTKQFLKKLTFDKTGFLASNEPINEFYDKEIAEYLTQIQTFYITNEGHTIDNISLNTIGHILLNDPGAKIKMLKNKIVVTQTITEAEPVTTLAIGWIKQETIAPCRKKTYKILIPNVYSKKKEKKHKKIIEELFDQPGFFESNRPINASDSEKATLLVEIKNFHKKRNGHVMPNIYLNAIAKNLLNVNLTEILIPDNQNS